MFDLDRVQYPGARAGVGAEGCGGHGFWPSSAGKILDSVACSNTVLPLPFKSYTKPTRGVM